MAAVTSCAPCAFGAVSTSLLSFPLDISTVQVTVVPSIVVAGNGSLSTTFVTSTLLPTATQVGGGGVVTATETFTDPSQLTWTVSGAVLTYPTTYVDYLSFQGAGATAAGVCAQTIAPTALTLPAAAPGASLIYPLDRTGALPTGLINYLDGAGFPAQLAGNRLETCAALSGALPITGTVSSVVIALTSATTITSAIPTTIPPPTTLTTTLKSTFTGSVTVAASQAVTSSVALVFDTATGNPVIVSGSVTSSLTAPLAVSLAPGTTSFIGAGTKSAVDITKVLSSIITTSTSSSSSKHITSTQTGVYTNTTEITTGTGRLPATSSSRVVYTGLAVPNAPLPPAAAAPGIAGVLAGLAAVLYL